MLRTFTTEAPFFSVARHTPLTFFHKMLRIFTTEASFFSVARDTIIACKLSTRGRERTTLIPDLSSGVVPRWSIPRTARVTSHKNRRIPKKGGFYAHATTSSPRASHQNSGSWWRHSSGVVPVRSRQPPARHRSTQPLLSGTAAATLTRALKKWLF